MKKMIFVCILVISYTANSQTLTILEAEVSPKKDSPYANLTVLVDRYFQRSDPLNGQWGVFGYARGDFSWATVMFGGSRQFNIKEGFLLGQIGFGIETTKNLRGVAGFHAKINSGTKYSIISLLFEYSTKSYWYRAQLSRYLGFVHLGLFGQHYGPHGAYLSLQLNKNLELWSSVGRDFKHKDGKLVNAFIVATRLVLD